MKKRLFSIVPLLALLFLSPAFSETRANDRWQIEKYGDIMLSVSKTEITLKEFFKMANEATGLRFSYMNSDLPLEKKYRPKSGSKKLKERLDEVSNAFDLEYKEINGQIVFKKKKTGSGSASSLQQDQTFDIKGTVVDSKTGEGLIGASVAIKGTTNGSVTNVMGEYAIQDVPQGSVLVVSFIGYISKEVQVGNASTLNIQLDPDSKELDEVVVTALGISREQKSLGYSVQDIKSEEFTQARELDITNSLAGRISGVHTTQGGGGIGGGGSRIVIRGESSLNGANNPLYVIDGIPVPSINDIAPDDIESISVLKGPAAAALYGSRAGGGVILITSKNGGNRNTLGLELRSSVTVQNPGILPEYQDQYGQGVGGLYNSTRVDSWGPAFDGRTVDQVSGATAWNPSPNNVEDFYETGLIFSNNVIVTSGDEKQNFRLSYTNVDQKGMIPNTDYMENRVDLSVTSKIIRNLIDLKANVKYFRSESDNNQTIDPRLWPVSLDLNDLQNYWTVPGKKQKIWLDQSDNPYFSLHENQNSSVRDQFYGNMSLAYKFNDKLSAVVRAGGYYYMQQTQFKGGPGAEGTTTRGDRTTGSYSTKWSKGYETNTDALLTYDDKIGDLSLKISAGGNMMSRDSDWINGISYQLLIPEVYTLGNYRTFPRVTNAVNASRKRINSLYAFANLGYKDMLFLDITARNDWTSSLLYKENDSFFYPSATFSVLIDHMLDLPAAFDMWKLRGGYAEVGNDTDPYKLFQTLNFTEGSNGVAGVEEIKIRLEDNLKPEFSKSFEFGSELLMYNNRLGLNLTYYQTKTSNQIWPLVTSQYTGYDAVMLNVGEVDSYGLEVTLNATPIKTDNFRWDSQLNWSMDRTELKELTPDDPDRFITRGVNGFLYTFDKPGNRRGDLYSRTARKFEYDPSTHDASLSKYNGYYYFDSQKDLPRSDFEVVGNYNPDWIGSWSNTISYKGLSLSALFFFNYGNDIYDGFAKEMTAKGLAKETGNRDEGVLLTNAVWDSPEGIKPFQAGDEIAKEEFYGDFWVDTEINDMWIKDGSFVKLKELSLSYQIPRSLLSKTFIQSANLSITGRNLYVWSEVENVDPEVFVNAGSIKVPAITRSGGIPAPRSWTFNLKITL
ncbi:SusC/RagA family TonB-linked outer membrane protein [Fulvitalea axinellae]|uniref:SusC/RagA family TonB-linked outer membrane protein n=1 Tax=Fulvitalea axinellae TaxID=1182444 RepID=A0AAU9CLB4_9BACT|nr:SusC/RagA family TonB-linked outer membrane protein [Fulvitalea axinellae]